jgi:hypothetical protein
MAFVNATRVASLEPSILGHINFSSFPCMQHGQAHPPLLNHTDNILQGQEMIKLVITYVFYSVCLCLFLVLDLNNLFRTLFIDSPSAPRARTNLHNHVTGKIIVLYCYDYRRGLDW